MSEVGASQLVTTAEFWQQAIARGSGYQYACGCGTTKYIILPLKSAMISPNKSAAIISRQLHICPSALNSRVKCAVNIGKPLATHPTAPPLAQGVVVNVSTAAAKIPVPVMSPYTVSKAALD